MNTLRYIKMNHTYADFSSSISPALELALEKRQSESTVVLNVFRDNSFTVGVIEDPEKCLDLEFCKNRKIVVRRRKNGGGAILGSHDSAFLVLYLDTRLSWVPTKNVKEAFQLALTSIADSLRELFGIEAIYRPLNDVEVDGKKLVPSSVRLENDILTMRVIINVAPADPDLIRNAVKVPPEKLQDKKIKDLGKRFTCLETETGRKITTSDLEAIVQKTIAIFFEKKVDLAAGELNELEKEYAADFQDKYTADDWLFANSESRRFKNIPEGAIKVEGRHKAVAGLIRVVLLGVENMIHDLIITGDFHPSPTQIIRDMEDALRGRECNLETVEKTISAIFDSPGVEIAGTEVEDFMAAFSKAFQQMPS